VKKAEKKTSRRPAGKPAARTARKAAPKRDFLDLTDLSRAELLELLAHAGRLKAQRAAGKEKPLLGGKTLAMIFEKPSTRTRVSFELAAVEQGGRAIFLSPGDIQLGRGESIRDTAQVLSRYCHAIVLRTFGHQRLVELARCASVPVINGLSDLNHPCQILADLLTVKEIFGRVENLSVAYVGDGNNVAHSWVTATALLGLDLRIASPAGYEPPETVLREVARRRGPGSVQVLQDPKEAARGAHVLYTDVWTSMGQEEEAVRRRKAFAGYAITRALLDVADPKARVLHCLPAHWGEEIEAELEGDPRLAIFDEAENRLHAQKALLIKLLGA